jgi:hypothetical protein
MTNSIPKIESLSGCIGQKANSATGLVHGLGSPTCKVAINTIKNGLWILFPQLPYGQGDAQICSGKLLIGVSNKPIASPESHRQPVISY